ncbi:MAG TPA: (5-formylfuran-3-yl)methyl phosphate synthase [Methylophilus sp.]|uniref:(5-formylfuran-3-yl)methyl phosphate synthase n=1 Tax=Methylophilus sp. TaxID=29541 RepID=UPI002C96DB89|nr:(5-formylfuran-3-yl)methyl phosphate synthase [Methylophilus sp.]HSH87438.1 (5-formylfuran-3-yl)methyl phosphate synthase [Methylophilus sp.]
MQVLVSVSSVPEVQIVLSADVRLIDLKDTSHGALAALDLKLSQSIVETVNTYRNCNPGIEITVSATIGDDCASVVLLDELIQSRLAIGVDVIKLPEAIWANANYKVAINKFLSQQVKLIAVLSPATLLKQSSMKDSLSSLAEDGYWGVMVDTIRKSMPLTALVNLDMLNSFVYSAKSLNLYVGLAGGLSLEQFDQLAELSPDYLGFRSGLCINEQRGQPLIAEKVQGLTTKLSQICCL